MVYQVEVTKRGSPGLTVDASKKSVDQGSLSLSGVVKRTSDIVFAIVLGIFFLPFILIVAAMIWFKDREKILFAHERVGLKGRPFNCIKFRSMVLDADEQLRALLETDPKARAEWDASHKLTNDPRLTSLGYFLRKTSLDELPQLWNVLKGDMSMVGPRPIVEEEARLYGPYFAEYKSVRPGLTGLWQVNGRSDTTYEERVQLDVEYVENRNFLLDLKVILKTVMVVVGCKGAV